MKKILSLLIILTLLSYSVVSFGAASSDLCETGKTVISIDDWVYEKINKDTQWEIDEYIGSEDVVYIPRFLDDLMIVSLGDHCFMNNTSVKSVITSSPLYKIGDYSFIDCNSLENVEIDFAIETIGIGAFSGTSSVKSINLENSVVSKIQPYTFYYLFYSLLPQR